MAGQAGRLQGQDRSAVTCPSSSHALRCLIWLSCDNRHLTTLEKFFPLELLPTDYGGMAPETLSLHAYQIWRCHTRLLESGVHVLLKRSKNLGDKDVQTYRAVCSFPEDHIQLVSKNYKEWLKDSEKITADLKKRVTKPKNQIIELEGSFKTLEID
ncbi:hypothetical protein J6590_070329 [Homalodisca vitripennis]|nr:hypothetical protein J6590_070329 [Homalodisca vitripennis]